MKMTKKELDFIWVGFLCVNTGLSILMERLNELKTHPKHDVVIFVLVTFLLYALITSIVQFFYMSNDVTYIDVHVLWIIFTLITGIGPLSFLAMEERLETFHYGGLSFVMLYVLYLYESYFDKGRNKYERTYFKRIVIKFKKLGQRRYH